MDNTSTERRHRCGAPLKFDTIVSQTLNRSENRVIQLWPKRQAFLTNGCCADFPDLRSCCANGAFKEGRLSKAVFPPVTKTHESWDMLTSLEETCSESTNGRVLFSSRVPKSVSAAKYWKPTVLPGSRHRNLSPHPVAVCFVHRHFSP